MRKSESDKLSFTEILIAGCLFTGIVLIVAIGEGTLFSGWHFVDDHEYLEWLNIINSGEMSWPQLLYSVWRTDFATRFRPLYFPYRIFLTYLFGADITAYAILRTAETVAALVLLYVMARCSTGNRICSFLFSMLSMTGYQAAVWWKLGPQEEECTILFAVGMILLERWLPRQRTGLMVGALASFVLMSLFHESYILVIPFIVCYVLVYSVRQQHQTGRNGNLFAVARYINQARWFFMISLTVYLIVILGIIAVFVGTNGYSGAGFSLSISPWTIMDSYYYAIGGDLKYYFFLGIPLVGVLLTYWDRLKAVRAEICLLLIFVFPQLLLYSKESMGERYILPMSIGLSWFFVLVVSKHQIVRAKRGGIYYALLLVLLVLGFRSTLIEANYYSFRGQSVTTAMNYIRDAAKEKNVHTFSMLGYSNPEADDTLDAWMIYNDVDDDIYYWDEGQMHIQKKPPFVEHEEEAIPLDQFDIAVAYNANDRHYTGKCLLVRDGTMDEYYTRVECGSLDIYIRNGSGLSIPYFDITY